MVDTVGHLQVHVRLELLILLHLEGAAGALVVIELVIVGLRKFVIGVPVVVIGVGVFGRVELLAEADPLLQRLAVDDVGQCLRLASCLVRFLVL